MAGNNTKVLPINLLYSTPQIKKYGDKNKPTDSNID